MSDMKCPFCQQELHKDSDGYYACYTDNCGCMKYGGNGASGSESLWLALIRTRKALDVAVDALKRIADAPIGYCMFAEEALDQITALEQKENDENI
jgi:hypothetical protein